MRLADRSSIGIALFSTLLTACGSLPPTPASPAANTSAYFDNTNRNDVLSGGARLIPIDRKSVV